MRERHLAVAVCGEAHPAHAGGQKTEKEKYDGEG